MSFTELYHEIHQEVSESCARNYTALEELIFSEEIALSDDFDHSLIQDSWSWRNVSFSRRLATYLVEENGDLSHDKLLNAIDCLKGAVYSLGPRRFHDSKRQEHVLRILQRLNDDKELSTLIKKCSKPFQNNLAEQYIRRSLLLPETTAVTDGLTKRAVLAALFTYLRQTVGSCFATAPAIYIQLNAPHLLVKDLLDLLNKGRLTRIVEGEEITAPLCPSAGQGDLQKVLSLGFMNDPAEKLSASPSLCNAFRAAGIWKTMPYSQEDRDFCRYHIENALKTLKKPGLFFFVTPANLIEQVLFNFYDVTKNEVEFLKKKLKQEAFFLSPLRLLPADRGKNEACQKMIHGWERARVAFVSTTENSLLKAWEFTIASFSESKALFTRWNLYSSLGLHPEEKEGIGETIKQTVERKIADLQTEIQELEQKADLSFAHLKSLEGRATRAGSERDLSWLQSEYQSRKFEYNRFLTEREGLVEKGNTLSAFFTFIFAFLNEKFKEYFQEIYDPEMLEFSETQYDDSPAGFRLLYKHGRSNTALWTLIGTSEEFILALSSFFTSIEVEINHQSQAAGLTSIVSEMITAILIQIKRTEFLKNAFIRLAQAYHESVGEDPLSSIDSLTRKPWAYISGGSMSTLLQAYFGLEKSKEEKRRWVENEKELIAFIFDTLKELPTPIQESFIHANENALLATSPTHAFLLKPGWSPFCEGWNSGEYPYTWTRDHWATPQESFFRSISFNAATIHVFVEIFVVFFPEEFRERVKKIASSLFPPYSVYKFRNAFLNALGYEKWVRRANVIDAIADELDRLLVSHLPFFSEGDLKTRVHLIFEKLELSEKQKKRGIEILERLEKRSGRGQILSAQELLAVIKTILLGLFEISRTRKDFHKDIVEAMRELGFIAPTPLLFADTNWVNNAFAFIHNPGTQETELWRMDVYGTEGVYMRQWKQHLNGKSRGEWSLFTNPQHYSS